MLPSKTLLSVIIPLFNEEDRVGNIEKIDRYLSNLKISWEIILVNDGSTDGTQEYIKKLKRKKIKSVSYLENKGKGYAVKQGMLKATGNYRLFIDVDLSTPISELNKMIPLFGKFDCLIGTRKAKGAKVSVHQPWLRENLGKGFTFLSQQLLGTPVSDFTCGFKCFSASCAEKVFRLSRINRWGFDSEILFLCHKFNFSAIEIPVTWSDDSRTRVKFPEDIVRSLSDLIKIRYNELRGLYS